MPGKGLPGAGGWPRAAWRVALGGVVSLCPLAHGNPLEPSLTRLPVPQLGWLREGGFPWPPVPAGGRGVPGLEALGRLRQRAGVLTADTDGEGGGIAWGQSQCGQGQPTPPIPPHPHPPKGAGHGLRPPNSSHLGTQSRSHPRWGPGPRLWAWRAPSWRSLPLTDRGPRGGSFSPQDFSDPALVLFEAMDFEEGASVELSEALPDTQLAGYGTVTQSIHVLSGV